MFIVRTSQLAFMYFIDSCDERLDMLAINGDIKFDSELYGVDRKDLETKLEQFICEVCGKSESLRYVCSECINVSLSDSTLDQITTYTELLGGIRARVCWVIRDRLSSVMEIGAYSHDRMSMLIKLATFRIGKSVDESVVISR